MGGGIDAIFFSHISPNATGLQLQLKGRAGRAIEFVSAKVISGQLLLRFENQKFSEKQQDK